MKLVGHAKIYWKLVIHDIERFYHSLITLCVEMKEKLKEKFLSHNQFILNPDPSLNHISQLSVSHVLEIENYCGQPMFDPEFVV